MQNTWLTNWFVFLRYWFVSTLELQPTAIAFQNRVVWQLLSQCPQNSAASPWVSYAQSHSSSGHKPDLCVGGSFVPQDPPFCSFSVEMWEQKFPLNTESKLMSTLSLLSSIFICCCLSGGEYLFNFSFLLKYMYKPSLSLFMCLARFRFSFILALLAPSLHIQTSSLAFLVQFLVPGDH